MNILLTGAGGFVGQHFLRYNKTRYSVFPVSVRPNTPLPFLSNIDVIVHLGGKAHEMKLIADEIYFTSNAELTRQLAIGAKAAGVRQFIYASSVKVYGNVVNESLNEYSECCPDDAYGKSKLLAEKYLGDLADENFVVSIIRPPLVYGAGVRGNMLKLLKLVSKNIPLPFGNINNKRSMVFVGNLIELINKLIEEKKPGIFIAGDAAPVSTSYLVSLIRNYLCEKKHLIHIPLFVQKIIKKFRYSLYIRLFGSFVIDNSATNKRLNFQPPYSIEEGIANMVAWYKSEQL